MKTPIVFLAISCLLSPLNASNPLEPTEDAATFKPSDTHCVETKDKSVSSTEGSHTPDKPLLLRLGAQRNLLGAAPEATGTSNTSSHPPHISGIPTTESSDSVGDPN